MTVFLLSVSSLTSLPAQTSRPVSVRDQLHELRTQAAAASRDAVLQRGAADVSRTRIAELQQQLETVQQRLSIEEAAATTAGQLADELHSRIARLEADLPRHEAADRLLAASDKSADHWKSLVAARDRLQHQQSTLRTSFVEWRSRAADAEQQLAALAAQRTDLDKAAGDARTALDAAEAGVLQATAQVTLTQQQMETISAALSEAEQQLASVQTSIDTVAASIATLERSRSTLQSASQLTGVDASATLQKLDAALADFAPVQSNLAALMNTVTVARDEQSAKLAAARAQHDAARAAYDTAVAAAEPLRVSHATAVAAVLANDTSRAALETTQATSARWQAALNAQISAAEPALQKLSAEIRIAEADAVHALRTAQAALEPLGRFVSFAREVAPVFARRCVACHNTRSSGGRLNLDSFAALIKGGESGAALDPHHSASSLMVMMMEDGSMPKDADPVSPEELALVRRWIDAGAPLDAGLSPAADLFEVMPELSQPLPPTEYRVPIPITAVAFSPDGSQLASSGYHEVLVWNTADGTLLRRITNVAERVYDIDYSPDGQTLAVAAGTPGQLGELKLFGVTDGRHLRTAVRARDAVFALAFSPDGSRLVCGGADRTLTVARVADGQIERQIEDHADWILDVNWSPDGLKLVSSSRDKSCKVFESQTGHPVVTFSGHGEPVYTAAFLADNQTVVSGGSDRKLRVWTTAEAREVRAIEGFSGDIFRLHVLAGDQVLAASGDRNLHLHNAADGAQVRLFAGHSDWVYTLSTHLPSRRLASGCYDGEVRIWNMDDGSLTASFIAIPGTSRNQSVATSVE
jgi:WD40 repeat protein